MPPGDLEPEEAPPTKDVSTELRDHVLIVTINRAQAMNAVTPEVCRGVADALMLADESEDVRVIVLTGAGDKVFCAGGDLKMISRGEPVVPTEEPYASYGFGGCTERTSIKPLVVAANGSAFGGGVEMMLAADIVVAERTTSFVLPEVKRGLIAAAAGVYRLPQKVARSVALDMLLTGEGISAERAYELGLVSRLVDKGAALKEALNVADKIASNAPLAVQASKTLALGAVDGIVPSDQDRQKSVDEAFTKLLRSADAAEGSRAFVEKRSPQFTAR